MRAFGVVFLAIFPGKHSCFEQVTEDFSAEEFVPECAIETFDVTAFSGSTKLTEPRLDMKLRQMPSNRFSYKLRPVIAPDEGRRSALGNEPVQHVNDVGRGNQSVDFVGETFTSILIDDWHPPGPSAIGGGIEGEVVAPYVVRIIGTQPHAAVRAASNPAPFPRFWAMGESILAPEAVHSLGIDLLSVSS